MMILLGVDQNICIALPLHPIGMMIWLGVDQNICIALPLHPIGMMIWLGFLPKYLYCLAPTPNRHDDMVGFFTKIFVLPCPYTQSA
ncbi:hypothetical protein [Microseira sp. BLCC-F43]|uniref:hypothetical protein n=1 Tax=Microseira sp. BLCC-F43 TaxID=3153602 RepID=UPI0035B917A9